MISWECTAVHSWRLGGTGMFSVDTWSSCE